MLETNKLTKMFFKQIGVKEVNIHIKKGDIYGLVGQNGAGKTTLMKMISGVSFPTSGEILMNKDINVGALIEQPGLFLNETATENIRRYAIISVEEDFKKEDISRLLQLVNLDNTGNKKVKRFSVGMKQRMGIAIALLGNPELLILDEPINGLDPIGIREMRKLLVDLNKSGKTIFISSHILDELSKIATKYGVMKNGCLIEEISASELKKRCDNSFGVNVSSIETAKEILDNYFSNATYFDIENMLYIYNLSELDYINFVEKSLENNLEIYETIKGAMTIEKYFTYKVG